MMERNQDKDESMHWLVTLSKSYWIPNSPSYMRVRGAFDMVSEKGFPDAVAFGGAFEAMRKSIQAVQDFLNFPYGLAQATFDVANVPGTLDVDKDRRLALFAKALQREPIAQQLQKMKQQATLLLWSAYETYCRDIFIATLNAKPHFYELLAKSPIKDKFQGAQIFSYGTLMREGFDLREKVGTLLAEGRDFSSPYLLRSLFGHVLPSSESSAQLAKAAESKVIWILGHRRHLVAHRGGLVDQAYIDQTGDAIQVVGNQLLIEGSEIEEAIINIAIAVASILLCVSETVAEIRRD